MTVHLFAWKELSGGGLQNYAGAFDSVELAETALVTMQPPAYSANQAQMVGVKANGELTRLRDYRRSHCWFDAQNCPHIDQSKDGVWVIIGETSNPMALVPGQRVEERVR